MRRSVVCRVGVFWTSQRRIFLRVIWALRSRPIFHYCYFKSSSRTHKTSALQASRTVAWTKFFFFFFDTSWQLFDGVRTGQSKWKICTRRAYHVRSLPCLLLVAWFSDDPGSLVSRTTRATLDRLRIRPCFLQLNPCCQKTVCVVCEVRHVRRAV